MGFGLMHIVPVVVAIATSGPESEFPDTGLAELAGVRWLVSRDDIPSAYKDCGWQRGKHADEQTGHLICNGGRWTFFFAIGKLRAITFREERGPEKFERLREEYEVKLGAPFAQNAVLRQRWVKWWNGTTEVRVTDEGARNELVTTFLYSPIHPSERPKIRASDPRRRLPR